MSCIEVGVSRPFSCRSTRTWLNVLGRRDARAVVACTVPTIREHREAAPIIYQRSTAAGSASAVIATAAERG
jgi:hypothetical protein